MGAWTLVQPRVLAALPEAILQWPAGLRRRVPGELEHLAEVFKGQ